jgi:hypothetical protein
MEEEEIRRIMEEINPNIPEETIQELIEGVKRIKTMKDGDEIIIKDKEGNDKTIIFHTLQQQIEAETDWKKKASLTAKFLSLGME